ncbi:hypothetical protein, partial [Streptococcus pneumoniae]|uniref:hypothetical protein n=1 Tax=Streptococcus pneumoniae TaxID=1313 RepID=UPI001E5EA6B9
MSEILAPSVRIEKLTSPYVTSAAIEDTKIVVSWPNSTQVIPTGFKLENVIVSLLDSFQNISNINNWYTQLT